MKLKNELFKSKRMPLIALFAGLLLVLMQPFINNRGSANENDNYGGRLEAKIEEMLEYASGCENVKVMITFRNEEEMSNKEAQSTFLFSENSKTEEIVQNEIAGVMIIARGITSPEDFAVIKNAVSTVLDITHTQIYIIGG